MRYAVTVKFEFSSDFLGQFVLDVVTNSSFIGLVWYWKKLLFGAAKDGDFG